MKIKVNTDFVDLGLPSGLKWATCNVGAKTPTEFGKYFRWGEVTDAREMGDVKTYDYTKPFEDAATHHIGKEWRMPTTEEFQELRNNITSKWVEDYQGSGINGRLFISKVNGNELFFPAADAYYDGSVLCTGASAYIWSSSLYTYRDDSAYGLDFSSGGVSSQGNYCRHLGFSVRGVRY